MISLDEAKELLIPGFSLLSPEEQEAFLFSANGVIFLDHSNRIKQSFEEYQLNNFGLWSLFLSKKKQENFYVEILGKIADYLSLDLDENILSHTKIALLNQIESEITALPNEDKTVIANMPIARSFQDYLRHVRLKEHLSEQAEATAIRADALQEWTTGFYTNAHILPIRKRIHSLQTQKLASFFPLLNYQRNEFFPSEKDDLSMRYLNEENHSISLEERRTNNRLLIAYLIRYCMNQITRSYFHDDSFATLNETHASNIALKIIQKLDDNDNDNEPLSYAFIQQEIADWSNNVIENLQHINGHPYKLFQTSHIKKIFRFVWGYLQDNEDVNHAAKKSLEFLKKMSDAHAFISATNCSTQNESSPLAYVDFFNYWRYSDEISTAKRIFLSFLLPFKPLYDEYRSIAMFERNPILKLGKGAIPILIVLGVVIGVSVAVGPLGLPDLVFTMIFILSIIAGAALATAYVIAKNNVFHFLRTQWYGRYQIPEFQTNRRMRNIFGTNADDVRDFYVNSISQLDEQIGHDKRRISREGDLDENEINEMKGHLAERNEILLEWYDIQNNKKFPADKAKNLAYERICAKSDQSFLALRNKIESENGSNLLQESLRLTLFPTPNGENRHEGVLRVSKTHHAFFNRVTEEKAEIERLDTLYLALE